MPGWESRASTVLYSRSSSFSVRVRCTWRWHAPHSGTVRCSSSRLNDRFARLFPWRLRGIKWCLVRRSTTRVHSPQIPPLSVILAITYRIVPGTLCRATVDSAIPQPGHRVGVHVLAIPEGEVMVCALDFEPELLIQGDRGGVVHIDVQLDAREVQPVVRQVQRRLHKRRPDAFTLPVVAHGHPDAADVTHAPAGRRSVQAEASDNLFLHASHQRI